ncbi:MAG: DUF3131 domain-containing protein [Pseudomonadota bacterium]
MVQRKVSKRIAPPVFFAVGLCIAAATATSFDYAGRFVARTQSFEGFGQRFETMPIAAPRDLTAEDIQAAEIAWVYLEQNFRTETGLVDSVAGFPSTTLWDQGSYLLGLVSAYRLGIVERATFLARVERLLSALETLPLVEDRLPNKTYDTRTLEMTDYNNNPVPGGIGWSALDISRLLAALRILERNFPEKGPKINKILARWSLDDLSRNGELISGDFTNQEIEYLQEGRIGYEQYGARAAAMWGIDVSQAISARRIVDWHSVNDVDVPIDLRHFSSFRAITPTLSEPYFLLGLELGFDHESHVLASRVYLAQEARFRASGEITMVSEDHVNQAPHFLYSSVYSNGQPWAVVTEQGEFYPELRTVSTKSAFAWDALFASEYTGLVRAQLSGLRHIEKGWAAGYYEADGTPNDVFTLNTNAVILEAIHFQSRGPLWQMN